MEKVTLNRPNYLIGIIYVALGIVLFFYPEIFTKYFLNILCAMALVYGGAMVFDYFQDQKNEKQMLNLLLGASSLIFGVVILFLPKITINLIYLLTSGFLIIEGILKIPFIISNFKLDKIYRCVLIINGLVPLIGGLITLFLALNQNSVQTSYFAIIFILSGSFNLGARLLMAKAGKEENVKASIERY